MIDKSASCTWKNMIFFLKNEQTQPFQVTTRRNCSPDFDREPAPFPRSSHYAHHHRCWLHFFSKLLLNLRLVRKAAPSPVTSHQTQRIVWALVLPRWLLYWQYQRLMEFPLCSLNIWTEKYTAHSHFLGKLKSFLIIHTSISSL